MAFFEEAQLATLRIEQMVFGPDLPRVADCSSQGELVRDMMDWFASREDFAPPDERTVRRKVSAIWRELVSAGE